MVAPGYDNGDGRRRWRALDQGPVKVRVEADAPRVDCPEHGPTVIQVPWARHNARHTRMLDAAVVWMVRCAAKSVVAMFFRIAWPTVGMMIGRFVAEADTAAGDRLANVRKIGIDEVSYKRGHKYLVVVVNHFTGDLLWVGVGRSEKTLQAFFDLLGPERCSKISLVSADGAEWIARPVAASCPRARLCLDPFHIVKWMNEAVDDVRRQVWNQARRDGAHGLARDLKGTRYALVKNPADLNAKQRGKLAWIQKTSRPLYIAWLLKEQLRKAFAPGGEERIELLDAWIAWAVRCQLAPIVEVAKKIRRHRDEIRNTLLYRLTNGPVEGMNSRIRMIINTGRGFRDTEALIALIRLCLCGYDTPLPYQRLRRALAA